MQFFGCVALCSRTTEVVTLWKSQFGETHPRIAEAIADPAELPNLFKDFELVWVLLVGVLSCDTATDGLFFSQPLCVVQSDDAAAAAADGRFFPPPVLFCSRGAPSSP